MFWKFKIFVFLFVITLIGCTATKQPKMSFAQKQALKSKKIEASYNNVFQGALLVFQDDDFIISNSDYNAGLILAEKTVYQDDPTKNIVTDILIGDYQKDFCEIKISATVSEISKNLCSVRLNIQKKYTYINTFSPRVETKTVSNRLVYSGFLNKIDICARQMSGGLLANSRSSDTLK